MPLTSRHESPASSLRITSQCFCMKRTSGRERCCAMWCTQWPTSATGSGICSERRPLLIGFQLLPPSSVRNAPADEMAMKMRSRFSGSRMMVCRHSPPAPGCHAGPVPCSRRPGSSLQLWPPSRRAEERGVLDSGVDRVGIVERRLEVPHARELPGMRRAVVPLVGAGDARVLELVAHRLPGLAAVVRALDQLPEPARALRRVHAIGIGRRSLEMEHLPAAEVGTAHVPVLALAVRRQHERTLARPDQHPYLAHPFAPFRPGPPSGSPALQTLTTYFWSNRRAPDIHGTVWS